jgi:DNA-binding beta-propeller fold protein YncE
VTDSGTGSDGKVYPIDLASGLAGTGITIGGTSLFGIAITPDGSRAYVTGPAPDSVTPISLPANTPGTPIALTGTDPTAVAITPDGQTAYVTDGGNSGATVTPITVSSNTAGSAITGFAGPPRGIAIIPDQAPVANFTVASAPPGSPTTFDASGSTVRFGTITRYDWNFGDGTVLPNGGPTPTHVYASTGNYTATVTETDSAGTSTTGEVYTGQTASRVGNPSAQASRSVVVTSAPAPAVSLSANSLSFGTVGVGTASSPQTLTITNTGGGPLQITSSAISGAQAGDYSLSADHCTGQTIAAGGVCSTEVTFTPQAEGGRTAQVAFSDNASGSPHTITLTGTGTYQAPLSGTVTFNGNPVGGASVQVCPIGTSGCQMATANGQGEFTVTVDDLPGTTFSLTASLPGGVNAGQGTLSPLSFPPSGLSALDVALPAAPSVPAGVTIVSPSHGTETSGTVNPVVFWNEPNQIQLARSLFPPNGTVVLTQVVLAGTNALTGAPMTKVVDAGGSVAGNPVGILVGNGPVSVTIPPLDPMHGQVTAKLRYQYFPPGTFSPTGVSGTQVLYEIYPPPPPGQALAPEPTDPLPAYFTNIGEPAGVSIGPGSITGPDAPYFSVVPLTSYGVPSGTTDCGFRPAFLQQFDQSTSIPPPSTACGIAVLFTPPPQSQAFRIFYHATLDVTAGGGAAAGMMQVALNGCDERVATSAMAFTGIDACGGSNPPDPAPSPEETPDPIPIPFPWVDPSGTVYARAGRGPLVPLPGATVTLQVARRHRGPFRQVPNRSVVMSPANRRNPDRSSILGSFGWDVLPGFYRVTATHSGCTAPVGKRAVTHVLTVPPPVLDLRLVLRCPHLKRAATHTTLRVRRIPMREITLTAHIRGRHPGGVVTFLHGRQLLGVAPVDTRNATATLTIRSTRIRGFTARYAGDGINAPSSGRE